MKFTREDIFEFLELSKEERLEVGDPIGLLGKTIPSTHCKGEGKKEKVLGLFVARTWIFRVECDCGFIIDREPFWKGDYTAYSPEYIKNLEQQIADPKRKAAIEKAKEIFFQNLPKPQKRIETLTDLSMHGWLNYKEVSLVSKQVRKQISIHPFHILRGHLYLGFLYWKKRKVENERKNRKGRRLER